jgi:predicted enzyme related to lactoylglutathione lyase
MRTHDAAVVLFTINLRSLAQFYERVFGMRVEKAEKDHVVLQKGSFRLIIHQIPEPYSRNIVISVPPTVRESSSMKLSLPVESISRSRTTAGVLGGCIYDSAREWVDEAGTFCDGWDPDGNVFQVYQPNER